LALAFRRRGLEVHYVAATRDRAAPTRLPEDIRFRWIERSPSALSWIKDLADYRRALDDILPDVVYQRGRSHLTYVAARWAARNRRRFVWGSNGEDSCTFWKNLGRLRTSARSPLRKAALYPLAGARDLLIHAGIRGATRVVTQTGTQAESLRRNFGRDGFPLPSLFPLPGPDAPPKEPHVLWLANLGHAKQPELFLELARGCADFAPWTFLLGGGTRVDAYRRAIEERAAGLPNVRMLGAVPFEDSHALYGAASLYVNTSRPEGDGLPNSFIQAWLHGTPVLSLHHDPNGWIGTYGLGACAEGSVERFVAAGRKLLADGEARAAAGARCAEFARVTFGAEETVDAYLSLFAN
jgi:glycosyltransferase involved in cell wall biosynthesis